VQRVLHDLGGVVDLLEPDVGTAALRVTEPVLTDAEVLARDAQRPVIVVPARVTVRGGLELVVQCFFPESGEPVRVGAVDRELASGCPVRSRGMLSWYATHW
jgi:hypothetical protein